ncbi:DUF1348-domain-containing protein [Mycena venus]|uniref:DUF1348-domain-containing protein n=1 Tax=Mycena venus TaxID=2733690 RepID=A0A8H7CFS9_9AGAR|nr:DUF1348-domain-containing protein [Mycena venus]
MMNNFKGLNGVASQLKTVVRSRNSTGFAVCRSCHLLPRLPLSKRSKSPKISGTPATLRRFALRTPPDTIWRNRTIFAKGREEVVEFLTKKWQKEHHYRLRKDLFTFNDNKIAVQFFYEWNESPDGTGQWYRCYGLEDWTYDPSGLMRKRMMSGNDFPISPEERWFKDGVDVDSVVITERHL